MKKCRVCPAPSNISAQDSPKWSEPFHNWIFAGGGLAKFLPLVADGHNNNIWRVSRSDFKRITNCRIAVDVSVSLNPLFANGGHFGLRRSELLSLFLFLLLSLLFLLLFSLFLLLLLLLLLLLFLSLFLLLLLGYGPLLPSPYQSWPLLDQFFKWMPWITSNAHSLLPINIPHSYWSAKFIQELDICIVSEWLNMIRMWSNIKRPSTPSRNIPHSCQSEEFIQPTIALYMCSQMPYARYGDKTGSKMMSWYESTKHRFLKVVKWC